MRAAIRREVALIEPLDDLEQSSKLDVLSWIDSGVKICRVEKPATPPKHLVSYVAVIDHEYVILVYYINAGLWLPTGGHVEPGEQLGTRTYPYGTHSAAIASQPGKSHFTVLSSDYGAACCVAPVKAGANAWRAPPPEPGALLFSYQYAASPGGRCAPGSGAGTPSIAAVFSGN